MTLRVVLVEDHVLMRAGLRLLVGEMDSVAVVGEASDGPEALHLIGEIQPDVVLLDIALGKMNGLEVMAHLHNEHPHVRVIMLSMHATTAYVRQALGAGAAGYLLKDAVPVELALAIMAVARGENYLSPAVAKHVIAGYVDQTDNGASPIKRLTLRQREILTLLAEGHTVQEIAQHLHISVKTAEGHRSQIMERLEIHDIPSLVRLAIREGLISP